MGQRQGKLSKVSRGRRKCPPGSGPAIDKQTSSGSRGAEGNLKEDCSPSYSTNPKHLPPGYTVGSTTVPCTTPLAPHCKKFIVDTQEHSQEMKHSVSRSNSALYNPKSVEELTRAIETTADQDDVVNTVDTVTGNAPIHSIVMKKFRRAKDKLDLLLTLLVYGKVDINLPNSWKRMTALQLAIEEGEELCIRALLAFGANINDERKDGCTALDLAKEKSEAITRELVHLGAKTGSQLQLRKEQSSSSIAVPLLRSYAEHMTPPARTTTHTPNSDTHSEQMVRKMELCRDLEMEVERNITLLSSFDSHALRLQQRDVLHFKNTLKEHGVCVFGGLKGGSRILSLDGGGVKGLVQLEILMQIEKETGRRITDLFDWIIGTSTGGIITLALVYGKKSLQEIFQLYFMMKDRIFSKPRIAGVGYNTEVFEAILKKCLHPNLMMEDVTHPKVLISAVNKAYKKPKLHFFNNCFGDKYMNYPVWKVARCTSATPLVFSECDKYVDGGVLCNNPTECGLTAIQNFIHHQNLKLPIALVVSIGTGIYPEEEMGGIVDMFLGFRQKPTGLIEGLQNLLCLLEHSIVESETVAENSRCRCREQGIAFYRFSPHLRDVISGTEVDNEKLFNMVIQTRVETVTKRMEGMDELVQRFHSIAKASCDFDPASL